MAQRSQVILISDLTGDEATDGGRTVRWSYDGVDYEIDLTAKEVQGFDKAIAMYRDHSRRVGGRKSSRASRNGGGKADRELLQAVRQWWRDQGNEIADRGRIPRHVLDAYHESH